MRRSAPLPRTSDDGGRTPPQGKSARARGRPHASGSGGVLAPPAWPRATLEPLVFERSGWSCDLCRLHLPGRQYSLQHRRARGAGGRRGAVLDTPWNLVLLCGSATTGCHGWVEQTGPGRQWAFDHGFAIRGEARDPAAVPIFRHRREWVIPSVDEHGHGLWVPANPI